MKLYSVIQYAKLKKMTRGNVYIQILTGKIPKSQITYETKKVLRIKV